MASYREIVVNSLWKNNPGLVQLLGLCPLLGVSNSVVNALGMGLATALVLACSNAAVSLIRNAVTDAVLSGEPWPRRGPAPRSWHGHDTRW